MSAGRREFLGLAALASLAGMLLIVPVLGVVIDGVPVHRLISRTYLLLFLGILLVRAGSPRHWPQKFRLLGLRRQGGWHLAQGAGAALLLFTLILALSAAAGGRGPADPTSIPLAWLPHLLLAVATAAAVSLMEELLFRGYLSRILGAVPGSLIYAAAHFFQPLQGSPPAGGPFDPWLAARHLHRMLEGWGDVRAATLGFGSLFLFGLALCRLRRRTGTLMAGIGMHAGLVFSLAYYRRFLNPEPLGSAWLFGGVRLHDGFMGLAAAGALLVLAGRWQKMPAGRRKSEEELSGAAL